MKLRTIHVSRYAPVMPSLWVDTSGAKPVLKAYVNGRYQTLSGEIPAGILTQDMIVNSLDSDAIDMPLSAAQGKILKSLLDGKQVTLTPGTGIEITDDNTINVTLDTTVFKVVSSLPDSPASEDMNKIHLVPSESTGENNSYKEYLWVNDEWEEIGTYVSTVDLAPYLTKEDAGKTYQKITDDSLQTQNKTVVGGINEVNAELKEAVKPYVINLTSLLAAQDSESISTAIGGIDNLNGTVQKNQVIFGTLANGTVAVGIRVLGNQTTLTYFVDSVVGLTVNKIIITNTSGTLTKTANTHAVLTENMVVNSLDSDETTLPLSAAQGKVLDSKIGISSSAPYVIDMSGLYGEPSSEEIDTAIGGWDNLLAAIRNSKLIVSAYDSHSNSGNFLYFISAFYSTNNYQTISLSSAVSEWDYNNSAIEQRLVSYTILRASNGALSLKTSGTRVISEEQLSALLTELELKQNSTDDTLETTSKKIVGAINEIKSSVDVNSYKQYLRKVYEEYGAVYNDETGYWEYGDLKDMTEEDCFLAAFYALEQIQGESTTSFILDRYKNPSARTYFTKITPKGSHNSTRLVLDSCFAENNKLEYLKLSNTPTSSFLYIENMQDMVRSSPKLRKIEDILTIYTSDNITRAFMGCSALKDVKIRLMTGANANLSFENSPLISYESIKYLVDHARNTAAITITVHTTTYSYLTGAAQPAEEVGGTTEEWQALVTTAQGKQISFA